MRKSIQGNRWGKNSPVKGSLNEVLSGRLIQFVEKDTKDYVDILFKIQKNQYGLYSEEYRPNTVNKDNRKKVDITAFIADEDNNKAKYIIADVKESVGGKDVIIHLVEQWNDGLKYINHSILAYLDSAVNIESHIMVITRNFDYKRVEREKEQLEKEYQKCEEDSLSSMVARKKLMMTGTKIQKEIEMIKKFIDLTFDYFDNGEKKVMNFEIGESKISSSSTYNYEMIVEL